MKKDIVKPTGLKGNEAINRMKELMGNTIKEDTKNSTIELTKVGPDGKIYGIVRENHKYFIKTVGNDKKSNLVVEDFKYMGGLQNKTSNAHNTYAKAIKQLNLKFLSLNESFGGSKVNVFENDTLINEETNKSETKPSSDEKVVKNRVTESSNDIKLTEDEVIIDRMVEGKGPKKPKKVNKFKIGKTLNIYETDDEINDLIGGLSLKEKETLIESLKKKV